MAGSFKKIFAGIFLLWFVLVIFAAVFYWPQIKESFAALTGCGLSAGRQVRQAGVPVVAPPAVAPAGAGSSREGFLWVDPAASRYIVTLGESQGASAGKKLTVYDGSDELGEVIVDKALAAVSYVRPAQGILDISQSSHGYYRVVMK